MDHATALSGRPWPAAACRGIPMGAQLLHSIRGSFRLPEPNPINALMRQVASGDRAAFAGLYDEVAAMVYGIALRVVRDPTRAEDVAQEAMIDVWRTAPRFDPDRGSAKGWIATIAHRRAVDVVRSEQASRDRVEKVGHRQPAANNDPVVEEVEDRDERSRVRAALSGLTDLQRQAIELAYYQGNTYRQVAEGLDAPLGTVKTRLRDGLKRLAEILEGTNG